MLPNLVKESGERVPIVSVQGIEGSVTAQPSVSSHYNEMNPRSLKMNATEQQARDIAEHLYWESEEYAGDKALCAHSQLLQPGCEPLLHRIHHCAAVVLLPSDTVSQRPFAAFHQPLCLSSTTSH